MRWLGVLVVLVVAGCAWQPAQERGGSEPGGRAGGTAVGREEVRAALRELRGLEVRAEGAVAPYERDRFGSDWVDVDGNGCNQRDDVLLRDAVAGSVVVGAQGGCDHDVLAGTWREPYSGRELVLDDLKDLGQAQAVQVDHVVALAEAWVSGADAWSEDRRVAFANDLDGLLAVDGPTNAAKSDHDPAGWLPVEGYRCTYAVQWVGVKSAWGLAADPGERRALARLLRGCRAEAVVPRGDRA